MKNNPKILDPSYLHPSYKKKTDLEFWECFNRGKFSYNNLITLVSSVMFELIIQCCGSCQQWPCSTGRFKLC